MFPGKVILLPLHGGRRIFDCTPIKKELHGKNAGFSEDQAAGVYVADVTAVLLNTYSQTF
jgi:hypothetical protein